MVFFTYQIAIKHLSTGATVSPIGPNEVPPPFQQGSSGGVPMVTCRVCAAMIDISSKKEQHVVKCLQCQEATVSPNPPIETNSDIYSNV